MANTQTTTKTVTHRKFGLLDQLAYGAGDFGCNMSFALKGSLSLFWTQFMGISNNTMALLLLLVQVWDAINDPVIGAMVDADKRKYKRNKFLAYIWLGSIGLMVAGALCFVPWKGAPGMVKNILFVVGYICWDAFYTIANVPYGSLLSLITAEPVERAKLSTARSIGSMLGSISCSIILPFLIYDASNNLAGERIFFIALVMGVLGFIAFQFMIRNTVIRVDEEILVSEKREKFNVIKAMGNFLKNRPAVGATLAAMGMFLGMQGATTANAVMFQSYFHNAQISGIIAMFAMIPIICFTPLARKMVVRFGKKEMATAGSVVSLVACFLMLVLPITPDGRGLAIYIVCQLLNSLGMGIYSTVSWAMMGDAIDYNEWKNDSREEGTVYALHSFFRKLAQGAGPSLALVIMVALGYVEADKGNQAFEVALNMRYLVAALYLVSAILQFIGLALIYNLDKKTLERMESELRERREEAAENAEV